MFSAWFGRNSVTVDDRLFDGLLARYARFRWLNTAQRRTLHSRCEEFLRTKRLEPVGEFDLSAEQQLALAMQACLPVLSLGLDYYRDWRGIVLYPSDFLPTHEYMDEDGVVHVERYPESGETLPAGPIVLAADEILHDGSDGVNVIVHECAHKLDMLNGDANGFPPLHSDMSQADWTRVFSAAFAELHRRESGEEDPGLDPYAGESPGEFFAVASEALFERPRALMEHYPAVYAQLRAFYRLDPLAAGAGRGHTP